MLEHLARKSDLTRAQEKFAAVIRRGWRNSESRTLVWRPASIELEIAHNGRYWFASKVFPNDAGEERHWNSFGIYTRNGNLQIAAEINLPTDRIDKKVSGFAARDSRNGDRFVFHDGGVGGGFRGVGRAAFLDWADLPLTPVTLPDKAVRKGILVCALDDGSGTGRIEAFLDKTIAFKAKVRAEAG